MRHPIERLPEGYAIVLEELKARINTARIQASLAMNRELIRLYWDIGKRVVDCQEREGWGRSVIERLAADIQEAFPGKEGFSPRNLWRMRAFYLAYTRDVQNLPQPVAEIPWGHNTVLLEKVANHEERN